MQTTALADFTRVTKSTIHRWCRVYRDFLSPQATPPKNQPRVFSETDVRILHFVATLRDSGVEEPEIINRLHQMQNAHWSDLPNLPFDFMAEETIPVNDALSRASQVAQVAVLQSQLAHKEEELRRVTAEVERLAGELETIGGERDEAAQARHLLEVQLAESKGKVAELEAEIRGLHVAYGFGRDRPVAVVVIVGLTALAAVLVVLLTVVVTRLLF